MGCIGARVCRPVAPYGPLACTGAELTGCCVTADGWGFLPLSATGFGGTGGFGAAGFAARGELLRFPRLSLLRAAFSALSRRSCSACVAIAAHTLSLTSFQSAICSSALANSASLTCYFLCDLLIYAYKYLACKGAAAKLLTCCPMTRHIGGFQVVHKLN